MASFLIDGWIHKVLLERACKLNDKNREFGIIPDCQVRLEVSRAEMMWWSVLLSGNLVLAPVTGSEVAMDELCNLARINCIMLCIVAPLFERHGACVEDVHDAGFAVARTIVVLPVHKVGVMRKGVLGGIQGKAHDV